MTYMDNMWVMSQICTRQSRNINTFTVRSPKINNVKKKIYIFSFEMVENLFLKVITSKNMKFDGNLTELRRCKLVV